ncbi:MAG: Hsp20/alpha crystallin family protein [Bryobacteraceae bacterium]
MRDVTFKRSTLIFAAAPAQAETWWQPYADVYRMRDGWLVKFELAGVRPEDIRVEVAGRRVHISGVRRDWVLEEGSSHYCMEIAYNRFERMIDLPGVERISRAGIDYRDGILLVRLSTKGD